MHKARKDILNRLKTIDVLVEIVDARIPFSSQNPLITEWRQSKPTVIVMSKSDLADKNRTQEWQQQFESKKKIKVIPYHKDEPLRLKKLIQICKDLSNKKSNGVGATNAMVLGIPNVGKSTLINLLTGRNIAKVGDEPAITKQQQKIVVDDSLILHDTPGILWPKIENPDSGYRLATIGSIKNTAIDFEDIGFYAAEYLLQNYPDHLIDRFKLSSTPASALECLEAIGVRRGAKLSGGRINCHKASEILIHEIRAGGLGRITLETPSQIKEELIKVEIEKIRLAEEKKQRGLARKGK